MKKANLPAYGITGFKGHYPVGTSAVVVAENKEEAFRLLYLELSKGELAEKNKDLRIKDVHIERIGPGDCVILQDGDY